MWITSVAACSSNDEPSQTDAQSHPTGDANGVEPPSGGGDGTSSPGNGDGGGPPADASTSTISLAVPTSVRAAPDRTIHVPVEITRHVAGGPVIVSVDGLPQGATAAPITIGSAETNGTIAVTVGNAAVGTSNITFRATAASSVVERGSVFDVVALVPGMLDFTFGAGGFVHFVSPTHAIESSFRVAPDGRIAMVSRKGPALVMVDADGAHVATHPLPATAFSFQRKLTLDGDKAVVVGSDAFRTVPPFAIDAIRVSLDGSVDTSFGSNGRVLLEGNRMATCFAIAIDHQHRVVLVGVEESEIDALNVGVAARLLPSGALDTSFGDGGYARLLLGGRATSLRAVFVDADDTLWIGGTRWVGGEGEPVLVHLTEGGGLHPAFGGGSGYVIPVGLQRGSPGPSVSQVQRVDGSFFFGAPAMRLDGDGALLNAFGTRRNFVGGMVVQNDRVRVQEDDVGRPIRAYTHEGTALPSLTIMPLSAPGPWTSSFGFAALPGGLVIGLSGANGAALAKFVD